MKGRLMAAAARLGRSGTLALAALLVALNLAANLLYCRWDLSEGHIYSVSAATKRILRELKDPVIVKVYFTRDLPQPYATHADYLRDLLRAYKMYAGRNFDYRFVSQADEAAFRREAVSQGIAPVQMTYIAQDKYEIKDGLMGAVVIHGDKREVIPVVRELDGLEYDLTSRIKKVSQPEPRSVALLSGQGTQMLPEGLEKALRENYNVRQLRLDKDLDWGRLPHSLLILGPREAFGDAELARLEQLALRGVALAFFLDTRNVDIAGGTFYARPVETGLDKLLEHWGLKLERSFVLDLQNQNISIQQQAGSYVIQNIVGYPLMPVVTKLDQNSPVTKGLDQIVMPFVSPVSTAAVSGMEVSVLAQSTRLSWAKANPRSLSPLSDQSPSEEDPRGPFTLAVSLNGPAEARFKSPLKDMEKSEQALVSTWVRRSTVRILAAGTSRLADPNFSSGAGNEIFILNTVDWLSQDSDLTAIRSKGVKIRPFHFYPEYAGRQAIKLAALFFMPAVIVLAGLWRWRSRRRWKRKVKEAFLAAGAAS